MTNERWSRRRKMGKPAREIFRDQLYSAIDRLLRSGLSEADIINFLRLLAERREEHRPSMERESK